MSPALYVFLSIGGFFLAAWLVRVYSANEERFRAEHDFRQDQARRAQGLPPKGSEKATLEGSKAAYDLLTVHCLKKLGLDIYAGYDEIDAAYQWLTHHPDQRPIAPSREELERCYKHLMREKPGFEIQKFSQSEE